MLVGKANVSDCITIDQPGHLLLPLVVLQGRTEDEVAYMHSAQNGSYCE